jgi:hypothetical protein
MSRSRNVPSILLGSLALFIVGGTAANASDAAVGVTATCPATGPGIVVCGTAGVLLHELVQIANGKEGFGPNGAVMQVLTAPVKIVDGNIRAAPRERGELAKVLRATTGISVEDIGRYGIFGGPNSIFRKPFG